MRKTTVIDNFLDFDLEKALINYEDRMFLFNIEETIGNFVINGNFLKSFR